MKSPIAEKVKNWIDERTGLVKFITVFMHEEIPGGTRFSYTLGSACLFLLTIQFVTGIWQLFYYVPTVDYAYSSLNYLRVNVPYGWLIHGFHKWGGTLFAICVGLHVLRVFIWGSYKKPRELVWLIGIFLIILTALFMFTGPVLPWDKKGYWAGQVGLGIAGSVPFIGPFTQMILQGANEMGQNALLRMYVMHVALIPGGICLFVVLHLIAFRQFGEAGPWDEKKRQKVGYFYPEQLFKDIVVAFSLFLLLVYLSAFYPPEFWGLADPKDSLYTPKPEWNFLFLYELLKYLPGHLEFVGTAGIPLLIVLIFGSLPFLDKSPERNPFKRGFVLLGGFAFVALILFFTYKGAIYRSPGELAEIAKVEMSENMHENKMSSHDREKLIELSNKDKYISGEQLFKTLGCTECHTSNGSVSNKQGPDLAVTKINNHRSREWLYDQIAWPNKHNLNTIMPPYSHLSDQNIKKIIDYLATLTVKQVPMPVAPVPVKEAGEGQTKEEDRLAYAEQVFNTIGCAQCHTISGHKSFKAGPDLVLAMKQNKRSKDWLKTQIVNPRAHNPLTIMQSFSDRLNEDQINGMVDFITSLENRKIEPLPAGQEVNENDLNNKPRVPGPASGIIGDKEHGFVLFNQQCLMCHGPRGNTNAKNFKTQKGVPSLNPVRPSTFDKDMQTFVNKIDVFIQHGAPNIENGPNMPNFGDSNTLTQAQIADIEAYVLSLNGVDRTQLINPGMDPKEFFYTMLGYTFVLICLSGVYWFVVRFVIK